RLLTQKNDFRAFVKSRGYLVPEYQTHAVCAEAYEAMESFPFPALLKPVDSSGSKGVTLMEERPETLADFETIWDRAMGYSNRKRAILEQKVERSGYQIAGDGFLLDGKLAFSYFANEHFTRHPNPLVPIGESFPCIQPRHHLDRLHDISADILSGLGMRVGGINFDAMVTADGDIFVIELGPRAGGNMIPEVTKLSCGFDLLSAGVRVAASLDVDIPTLSGEPRGHYSSYMVHAKSAGILRHIEIHQDLAADIVERRDYAKIGVEVHPYSGANRTVGGLILRHDSMEQMLARMDNMERYLTVHVDG
ncbi:ATP-grasp domain-containing protein, partial [Alphaproteobacteria bacterium]|nr:ATP-grasp domain-containing protein [Alphaproteobacteria bacterium]